MWHRIRAARAVRLLVRLLVPPLLAAGIAVPAWLANAERVLATVRSPLGLGIAGAAVAIVAVCLVVRLCTGSEFAGWYAEVALPAAALCLVLLPLTSPAGEPVTDPRPKRTESPAQATAVPEDEPTGEHVGHMTWRLARDVDTVELREPRERVAKPTPLPTPEVFADVADATAGPDETSELLGVLGRPARGTVRLVDTGVPGRPVVEVHDLGAGPPGTRLEVQLVPGSTGQRLARTTLGSALVGRGVQAYRLPRGVRLTEPATVLIWQPQPGILLATASVAPQDHGSAERPRSDAQPDGSGPGPSAPDRP